MDRIFGDASPPLGLSISLRQALDALDKMNSDEVSNYEDLKWIAAYLRDNVNTQLQDEQYLYKFLDIIAHGEINWRK